jgi:hypothetical protein
MVLSADSKYPNRHAYVAKWRSDVTLCIVLPEVPSGQ